MSDVLEQIVHTRDEFRAVRCCGELVGVLNTRPFTPAAVKRFCEIQNTVGAAWVDDPDAKALLADPASYASLADGTICPFACGTCKASFVIVNGEPVKRNSGAGPQ